MNLRTLTLATLAATAALSTFGGDRAEACGGFFCSQNSPVNQAAERIIFIDHDDDTVTALVQIMYAGPSENFAWVLPVPGVPDVGISSDQAFQTVQQLTNPQYFLQTQFEDDCRSNTSNSTSSGTAGSTSNGTTASDGGVNVLASGSVGPYDYTVIMTSPGGEDLAQDALDWLEENGYDITATAPELIRPYLEDGMNLLAFKLTKGNTAGDIRPVRLTYDSVRPMIPLKLTAVAANDNMGVLVWILGDARSVPINYRSLVLNEALINWFNPGANYNQVINTAADEAGGQGFVTEMAGRSDIFVNQIFSSGQDGVWAQSQATLARVLETGRDAALVNGVRSTLGQIFRNYNGWDGMGEAARVLLPDYDGEALAGLTCVASLGETDGRWVECGDGTRIDLSQLDYMGYLAAVEDLVIAPMRETQELLVAQPYMTRMYTTLSAAEMTLDPVFDVNSDLDDVSNIHQATQWVSCDPQTSGYSWRVELPQGSMVYGQEQGQWSYSVGDMPANARVTQQGTDGEGEVVEDNLDTINGALGADAPSGSGFDDEGCACASVGGARGHGPRRGLVIVLGLLGLVMARRR